MVDKPAANLVPTMYAHRVHELQTICRANGYALALHGSMQRDLDAIAVPWADDAIAAEVLVERICEGMGLLVGPDPATQKPHGRRVWTLLLGVWGFVDLSVMPTSRDLGGRMNEPTNEELAQWVINEDWTESLRRFSKNQLREFTSSRLLKLQAAETRAINAEAIRQRAVRDLADTQSRLDSALARSQGSP